MRKPDPNIKIPEYEVVKEVGGGALLMFSIAGIVFVLAIIIFMMS